ncbi:MAG: reverse transcriptase-like protein [bacterium]|nr:reverse transcriptase-like protein [bacterium]
MKLILQTDGGARGNPGPAGIGMVIEDAETKETLVEHGEFIGHATNNVAEYRALLWGLKKCHELHAEHVEVRADSELLVKQMNGEYRVKNPDLAQLYLIAKNLGVLIGHVTYYHVPRIQNKRADALANKAMDEAAR